ncbi:hypothetical protein HKX48_002076 [Thoreauomyces humboldtii]|nr:hypothetical protein HKX48_002076 [Thoreauomyces humboldtii]
MPSRFPPSFAKALASYDEALALLCASKGKDKGDHLAALDHWMFGGELLNLKELNVNQLAKVMEWKLSRGKFRPTLMALVKRNSDATVKSVSEKAFARAGKDPVQAVKDLCELSGVGPATASAILSAHTPELPFMSDEALSTIYPSGKLPYTNAAYVKLLQTLREKAEELNGDGDLKGDVEWTAGKCERAIWAWAVSARLKSQSPEKEGSGEDSKALKAKRKTKDKEIVPGDEAGSSIRGSKRLKQENGSDSD